MAKFDWRRARIWRERESKYGQGITLPNGSRTPRLRKDELTRRAANDLRQWVQTLTPAERRWLEDGLDE
jgi:hypothetical protein